MMGESDETEHIGCYGDESGDNISGFGMVALK